MTRSRWLLVLIAVIGIVALWWVFLITPRRADVSDLRVQRQSAIDRQASLRAERAALLDIQENELTYITAAAALERLIPPTPDLATFIDDVTLLAATTGVELTSMAPSPPAGQPLQEFQEISVAIDIQGQFFEILGFLYGLADMERLVRVDGLSLAPVEGATGEIVVITSLDATIFTTSTVGVAGGDEPTTTTTTVPAGATTTSTSTTSTTAPGAAGDGLGSGQAIGVAP